MEWIPVSERMPADGDAVLVYLARWRVFVVARADYWDGETVFRDPDEGLAIHSVTHWMPLPAPPEVK